MAYLFVGAGQAGSAILDSVFKYRNMGLIAHPLAINSTAKDLSNIRQIKRENWLGISEKMGIIDGTVSGFEEKVTGGFGKNPVRATEVLETHYSSLLETLKKRITVETKVETKVKVKAKKVKATTEIKCPSCHAIVTSTDKMCPHCGAELSGEGTDERIMIHEELVTPFAFIFLGLGGGTGCGISPLIAKALKELSEQKMRIIAVVILPAAREALDVEGKIEYGDRQSWNANYGINQLKDYVDSFILVDNQKLAYRTDFESLYPEYNDYIATSIADLTAGILLENVDPSKYNLNPPVIDINDIITATSFDTGGKNPEPGFAVLGRSSIMSRGLLQYFIPIGGHKKIDTLTLSRVAAEKLTVANINLANTHKNLALIRVPPYYLGSEDNRIDTKYIEDFMLSNSKLRECHLGISLTKRNLVSLTTLFTYKQEDLDRIKEIADLATKYEEESGKLKVA
jgi:hypothetical protein